MSSGTEAIGAGASLAHLGILGAVTALGTLAWHALTRGLASPIDMDGLMGAVGIIWAVPAIYLAAWQVLSFASLRRALRGAAVMAGVAAVTFGAALALGLITVGLLALPAGAVGVALIGRLLATEDAADAAPAPGAGRAVHIGGLMIALAGLVPAFIGTMESYRAPAPPLSASAEGLLRMLLPWVLIFAPHAVLAWQFRGRAPLAAPWRRGGVMLLLAWAAPVPFLGPAWMLDLPGRMRAEHEEFRLFAAAGGHERGLHPGARMEAAIGEARVVLTVPEGWLGLYPVRPGPEPARQIEIARDPRAAEDGALLRRLRIMVPAPMPMVAAPAATAEHDGWHALGCTEPDATLGGAVVCRQTTPPNGEAAGPALAARWPEAALTRPMLARYATGPTGYLLLAPGMRGSCYLREACRLRFAVPGGAEVEGEIPEEAAARWPEAREDVARLLREASGLVLPPGEGRPEP